jgi:hypothetical protein
MTGDQVVPVLAWLGLALWVGAFVLFVRHRDRAAAALQAVVALPFLIAPVVTLLKWRIDPASYVRQYGTGALAELPWDGIVLGLSLVILLACGLAIRHHRFWVIVPFLLNGIGLAFLFYLAYFFRVF